MKILICITGASGVIYGIKLLKTLQSTEHISELIISPHGERNIELETKYIPDDIKLIADKTYKYDDLEASVASGSYQIDATVVIPCSMKTLSSIAHGYSNNLITRAADVALKEQKTLIVVPRETPLNIIHIENMRILANSGAIILPPMPAFYNQPETINDIIIHTVGKILDILDIANNTYKRWNKS